MTRGRRALVSQNAAVAVPGTWPENDAPAKRSLNAGPQVIRRFNNASRLKGSFVGWLAWAPCADWPVRGEDNNRGPWTVITPNPILLIKQRYDPQTGYANAVHVE